jgi:pyruvate dehydrogenase E1 component alpha subunit
MKTYRYRGHSMSDPQKYRTKEEVQREQQRDPIERLKKHMLENNIESEDWFKALDKEIRAIVQKAADFADSSPEPPLSQVDAFVYA